MTNYTLLMRANAVLLGLAGIIAVHVLDLQGKMDEVPYLGFGYIAVILAAGALMVAITTRPSRTAFLASAALAAAVVGGYVVNRTVGMPNATDDIGNWFEPLGVLSLVAELFVIGMGLAAAFTVNSTRRDDASAESLSELERSYSDA